jgi:acyl-homoserine lactone acylase PvdQ
MARSLVLIVTLGLLALAAPAQAAPDYGKGMYNVLPAGAYGGLPLTKHSTDQIPLFDGLTPLFDQVTAADIPKYFKPETFGVTGAVERTERPRKGVTIQRDSFGVAHITGTTRSNVEFGTGWVSAEDRGLFMEAIRGPARIAALDVPGEDAFELATSLRTFLPSRATERALDAQVALLNKVPGGKQVLRDAKDYVAGVNAYYRKIKSTAKPWTPRDVAAVASLIGAVFGKGGGKEVASSQILAQLQAKLGSDQGFSAWRDLVEHDDAEAPTTVAKRFPFDVAPQAVPAGSLVADPAPAAAASAAPATAAGGLTMSNALLVGASASATGRPLITMGPQVGFFYPAFFVEMDIHGGGLDARGVAFPGIGMYVLVGRGKDFAYSATSAGTDIVDQFLEQLCNKDGSAPTAASTSYMYKGKCRPMTSFNAGVLKGANGSPDKQLTFRSSVHGPISGTVTSGGKPYAVALARSTRGRDVTVARFFEALSTNKVRSARDFIKAASGMDMTFNWFYADNRDIAYFSAGRLPKRAPGTYPGLPTLGTGQYDWRGFLPASAHPQAINPSNGQLLSWNNKPAPGFGAADNEFSYGATHRVQLFKGIPAKATLADLVSVMNRAATQDLRALDVWPIVKDVLATGPAPDAMTQQAADVVTAWSGGGGSRLDRDGDGKVDDPGAAVLDAAFVPLATAVLKPVLGDVTDQLAALAIPEKNPALQNSGTSTWGAGWYGYVTKDLRSLLGQQVASPFSRRYCGNGDLDACRASLWAVVQKAAQDLAAAQGPDPAAWRADANAERIKFRPGLLTETMRWSNRPTFQQVGSFSGHRKR